MGETESAVVVVVFISVFVFCFCCCCVVGFSADEGFVLQKRETQSDTEKTDRKEGKPKP